MRRRELFTASSKELTLSATSGSCIGNTTTGPTFTVKYGDAALISNDVSVTSSQTWCTPSWTASASTVSLTVTKNSSLSSSRSALITVSYDGKTATYNLTQSTGTLSLSPSSITNVEPTATTRTVYVQVNGSNLSSLSSVTVSSTGFISYTKNSSYITVTIPKNETSSSRSGTLGVAYGGHGVQLSVTQKADYVTSTYEKTVYNKAINFTTVSDIKPFSMFEDTAKSDGYRFCSNTEDTAFAIYGNGTYVSGSNKSKVTTTYYASGRKTTTTTTLATYSGSVTNGFAILSFGPNTYYNTSTTPVNTTQTTGNITCNLTISGCNRAVNNYCTNKDVTISYNSLTSNGKMDFQCL